MPVPDTYSRRIGNMREESYSSTYSSTRAGRPSYLSTYTSKFSTLPPRPPAYERKYSELNTSTTGGSRFLNGTSTGTRTSSSYSTSSYARSSVSPVRATTGSLRRSLEGGASSLTDRLKSIELAASEKESDGNTTSGYKYFTRNRDSSLGSATTRSTPTSAYGSYATRDRSGSRELGSSPLTTTSATLNNRDKSVDSASRSRTSSGGSSQGPTSALERIRERRRAAVNGPSSRNEVTMICSSSSDLDCTTQSATTTNCVTGADGADRGGVDSNDEPDSSLSSAVGSSAASSPPLADRCNREANNPNLTNGNDPDSGTDKSSSSSAARDQAKDCGRAGNDSAASSGSGNRDEKTVAGGSIVDSADSATPPGTVDLSGKETDSNGNPIIAPPQGNEGTAGVAVNGTNEKRKVVKKTVTTIVNQETTASAPPQTGKSKVAKVDSDANANVVESKKLGKLSTTTVDVAKKPDIGVSASLLKPKTLSSSKVTTKSKIIVHKFNVEDTSPTSESPKKLSPSPGPEPRSRSKTPEKGPSKSSSVNSVAPSQDTAEANVSVSVTLPRKSSVASAESSRHGNSSDSLTKKKPAAVIVTSGDSDQADSSVTKSKSYGGNATGACSVDSPGSEHTVKGLQHSGTNKNLSKDSRQPSSDAPGSSRSSPSPSRDVGDTKITSSSKLLARSSLTEPGADIKSDQSKSSASITVTNTSSRSPSPAVVTITLPRKDTSASQNIAKAPTPPPLPALSTLSSTLSTGTSAYSRNEGSGNDNVTSDDAMAGPHSSKYTSQGGKSNITDQTPRSSAGARRNNYPNTSDSSDNVANAIQRLFSLALAFTKTILMFASLLALLEVSLVVQTSAV